VVRRTTLHREVQRRAQRPEVGGWSSGTVTGALRCDVLGRTEHEPGAGDEAFAVDRGDPEVGQDRPAVVREEDVGRLDVPVPDTGPVGGAQRGGDLKADRCDLPRWQRAVGLDDLVQRARRHVLHYQPRTPVGLQYVVHAHDVRVVDPGCGAGLAQRAALCGVALAADHLVGKVDLLDRDVAAQHLVPGQPDPGHAAYAQRLAEPVASGKVCR
jgi:hypothetical protein